MLIINIKLETFPLSDSKQYLGIKPETVNRRASSLGGLTQFRRSKQLAEMYIYVNVHDYLVLSQNSSIINCS
jgi:hypothetical protein